jgi:Concanavalin A-like lectin/glucanases superfamily
MRFLARNPPNNTGGVFIVGTKNNLLNGDWHHFAAVKREDGKLYLYIDGEPDGISRNTIANFPNTDGHKLLLGMNAPSSKRHFKGTMDEISLWSRARTVAEITAQSKDINTSSSQELIGYYKFNQGEIDGNNTSILNLVDSQKARNGTFKGFQLSGNTSNFRLGVE